MTIRPPGLELLHKRLGHLPGRGGDEDFVKWRMLGPSARAVTNADRHVGETDFLEPGPSRRGELLHNLNAPHPSRKLCHDGGLVAEPGADFENRLSGLRRQEVDHQCANEWLGDCLVEADRQCSICVGQSDEIRRVEVMSRHQAHCSGDALVEGAFAELIVMESMADPIPLDQLGLLGLGSEVLLGHGLHLGPDRTPQPFRLDSGRPSDSGQVTQ